MLLRTFGISMPSNGSKQIVATIKTAKNAGKFSVILARFNFSGGAIHRTIPARMRSTKIGERIEMASFAIGSKALQFLL